MLRNLPVCLLTAAAGTEIHECIHDGHCNRQTHEHRENGKKILRRPEIIFGDKEHDKIAAKECCAEDCHDDSVIPIISVGAFFLFHHCPLDCKRPL